MDTAKLLHGASRDFLDLFGAQATAISLAPGETLFEQQDHDDRLYMLDEGLLEVSVIAENGRRLALNQLKPGNLFGEIAVFDPGPRTATVSALRASRLRAIRNTNLLRLLEREPRLLAELLRLAGRRMRFMSQQMEDQVFMPPAARLAANLLRLADDSGEVRLSQAQLADYVGVTRELVSKTLSDWRKEGLVALSRGKITVMEPEDLENLKNSVFF